MHRLGNADAGGESQADLEARSFVTATGGTVTEPVTKANGASLVANAGNATSPLGVVAVIDDDESVRHLMRHMLEREGFAVVEHAGAASLLRAPLASLSVVCLDLALDGESGMAVLMHLRARAPDVPVVVVTADRTIDVAVEAMRAGAYDYVVKPLERERLAQAVRRAAERRQLALDVARLESELGSRDLLRPLVGDSPPMRELARQIERVISSDIAVCVTGESGTGKEVVARAIHAGGRRKSRAFVAINCAAIPAPLQESELFGHEKGAFTGAHAMHKGRFEQADGGTLFLDEVGEMSPATQAGLLRALEERTIRRVGGENEVPVDVRIVCATHRDLEADVRDGRFREDLYFRLVAYPIRIAPLRERREDVPLLVVHFLNKLRQDVGRDVIRIAPDAMESLIRHNWPGNVRGLQNVVHRAMLACEGDEIQMGHLPTAVRISALPPVRERERTNQDSDIFPSASSLSLSLRDIEKRAIEEAMHRCGGRVGHAAKLLGIGRATLYRRLAEIDPRHAEQAGKLEQRDQHDEAQAPCPQ